MLNTFSFHPSINFLESCLYFFSRYENEIKIYAIRRKQIRMKSLIIINRFSSVKISTIISNHKSHFKNIQFTRNK